LSEIDHAVAEMINWQCFTSKGQM